MDAATIRELFNIEHVARFAPGAKIPLLGSLVGPISNHLPPYSIDTAKRVAMFLAQAAHETAGFRTLVEFGSDRYFDRYEGRENLGNVHPGDGLKFKGRGIFQITGRDNYRRLGDAIGVDLAGNPERAAEPDIAVRLACLFWQTKGFNELADRGAFKEMTISLNGGLNGWDERRAYHAAIYPIVKEIAA